MKFIVILVFEMIIAKKGFGVAGTKKAGAL